MKKGDAGPLVLQMQRDLIELGYALPRYGDDGQLGDETLGAVEHFARDHYYAWADRETTVGSAIMAAIADVAAQQRNASALPPLPNLIDRRSFAGLAKDGGPRPWTNVKGWCLHQTACWLSTSRDIARCDQIGAHYVVYPDGRIFRLHDLNRVVWHGNGFNGQTIGIEIDGNMQGVEGDDSTRWAPGGPAGSVTDAQIDAVKAIIRADYAEIVRHGGKPTVIVPHRCSSADRRDDPGSKIWQTIGMPMLAELRLSDGGPGFAIRDGFGGMPIPEAWDSSRTGIPY